MISAHGIPVDLLDRLLIIKTSNYGLEDLMKIIAIRAST
jgi:RuvB-like protein 1 (pontin 52)